MNRYVKRKKTIILSTLVTIALGVLLTMILVPRRITYYYEFPHRYVRAAHRELTREIYNKHTKDIAQVMVAEDSRSRKCIRFVFVSDKKISADVQDEILGEIFCFMESDRLPPLFPLCWEIFFCENGQPYSAYISRYGDDSYIQDDESFTDWYQVPEVEKVLSFTSLKKMLKRTAFEMYSLNSTLPIDEIIPDIPS